MWREKNEIFLPVSKFLSRESYTTDEKDSKRET